MKSGIAIIAVAWVFVRAAWAINSPTSPQEFAAIQNLIDSANEINNSLDVNKRTVVSAQNELSEENLKGDFKDKEKVARLTNELRGLKKSRDNLYLAAMKKTLVAYDLVPHDENGLPVMPTKDAVHPAVKGRKALWIVVYKDDTGRTMLDNAGKTHTSYPGGKTAGGETGADGVTTLYGQFRSPADLALLLYHEQVHYEQFTTRGVGDMLTFNEREEKAYTAQFQHLGQFGLTAVEKKAYRGISVRYAHQGRKDSRVSSGGSGGSAEGRSKSGRLVRRRAGLRRAPLTI